MARTLTLGVDEGIATIRIGREHGNAINETLVDDLISACQEVEGAEAIRGVLLAASGKLFSPGLDLQELVELDRAELTRFLGKFNAAILMLYTVSKPMVAVLHGHAIAGGLVVSLTADWRVLCEGAKIGLNEVRVGVPFPFGVSMILRESVPRTHLEEVALFGRNYSGQAAIEAGLVHEVRPAEGFEDACRQRLEEFTSKDRNAFAVTKRYLRSATVERIRANDSQFNRDFLDGWFSEATQERVRGIVAELRSR